MAEAQDTLDVSDVKDNFLQCSVCLEHFDQEERRPRLLVNCLHAFCSQCLEQLLEREGGGQVKCPNCRQVQQVKGTAKSLPVDPVRNKLVDYVQFKKGKKIPCTDCPDGSHAAARCHECKIYMCTRCNEAHHRNRMSRKHTCVSLEGALSEQLKSFFSHFCEDHPDHKIEFYCRQCSSLCCVSCSIWKHKGHDLVPVEDAANSMLSSMKTKMDHVEKSASVLRRKKASLEKESAQQRLNLQQKSLSINHTFEKLNGQLKMRQSKLMNEIQEKTESTVNSLKKQQEATEDSLAQMESTLEYFKQMESKSDDCEVLSAGPVLVQSLEAAAAVDPTQDVQHPTWTFLPEEMTNIISLVHSIGKIANEVDMAGVTVGDVAKAEKKVMSPAEVKEDLMLVLGASMNWQEMLNPAPLCLLGQLVLVTLEKDVSLVSNNMERKTFKHVRHPDSLSTSMVQVANEGWSAFNTANKNMDHIRLLILQVPQHVKNAVKFIIGGSNEKIEELVPDILSNITRISETCTEKAKEVETVFTDVMELIGEACTLAKGEYEEKLRKAEADKEITALTEVKTQWGKLVRFFQTMAKLIKCCLDENVKNFVQIAEKGKKFRLNYRLSDMLRDMIFTLASEANKITFIVNNLSSMYIEISEKHIMDQVASLGQLLALDPETEKHLIFKKQLDLRRQAQDATSSIADIVRQKQREFDTKIQKRIQTIETEMRAVLPPPKPVDPEMEAEMKRAIQDAQEVKKEEQEVDDWV